MIPTYQCLYSGISNACTTITRLQAKINNDLYKDLIHNLMEQGINLDASPLPEVISKWLYEPEAEEIPNSFHTD